MGVRRVRFKVVRAKISEEGGDVLDRWIVTDDLVPDYGINEWIDLKSMNKLSTGREYAYKLIVFLNYLEFCNKSYKNATTKDVLGFVLYIIYGYNEELKIHSDEGRISYSTLSKYITVITEFYKWLDNNYDSNIEFKSKNNNIKVQKSFMYGQIWKYEYKYIIDKNIRNLQGSREYIKWYTVAQKEIIVTNLYSLRDKAVFLLTLEGFRIDEVLSMELSNYDGYNTTPSRSKGKPNGISYARTVALPQNTCKVLDKYILTERASAELLSGVISQTIFINIKKGINQGKPLKYRAYWEIFKRCAGRCSIDPLKVRTHSGRSTKVMEFLEKQACCPEENITDALILYHFGWKNIDILSHYRDFNNKVIAKSVFDKLHKNEVSNDR